MNIVLGHQNLESIADRYIVLRLDAFASPDQPDPVQSYCVIESVPIQEMGQLEQWKDLHEKLIKNYGLQNWDFCEQAIEHLMSRWNGELDSFYQNLLARVRHNRTNGVVSNWTPTLTRQ